MGDQRETTEGYRIAHEGVGVLERGDRVHLAVHGIGPGEMLKGILSGRIPATLSEVDGSGWWSGDAPYSTMLTPKGKMVTDLRVLPDEAGAFLLDLPLEGMDGALAHFKKYLNPRFGQVEDRRSDLRELTLVGPGVRKTLDTVFGWTKEDLQPGRLARWASGTSPSFWLVGNGDVGVPAVDVILPALELGDLLNRLQEAGADLLDKTVWETLRIEAGTPRFGLDMTTETIPVEAGIGERAIDHEKGCYTGQEVIVRIRDRGKVNKQLRWIQLGDAPLPEAGTELFCKDDGKVMGWITSACYSPRSGGVLALGMVRRGVVPGEEVGVGGPDGPWCRVAALPKE